MKEICYCVSSWLGDCLVTETWESTIPWQIPLHTNSNMVSHWWLSWQVKIGLHQFDKIVHYEVKVSITIVNDIVACHTLYFIWQIFIPFTGPYPHAQDVRQSSLFLCVCLSIPLSVTRRYCNTMAKHTIMQIDSPWTHAKKSWRNSDGVRLGGAKYSWGRLILAMFN